MSFLDPPRLIYPYEAPTECGVRAGTVRQWVKRGKLHPRGVDEHGRNQYDVKDIEDLAAAARQGDRSSTHGDRACNVRANGRRVSIAAS